MKHNAKHNNGKTHDSVSGAFNTFDDALKLDPNENSSARTLASKMSDAVNAAGLAARTFIQGSFGRKTMLPPLKDVDIVIVFAAAYRYLLSAANGPAEAMALVRAVISKTFPGARFDVDDAPAKALRVTLPGVSFTFDLVMAFDDGPGKQIVIGDRETRCWEPSNVQILLDLVSARNVVTGGAWVHQARMFKAVRVDHPVLGEECGLLFESLLYDGVTRRMSHQQALATVLTHTPSAARGAIFDPTREEDLTGKWSDEHRAQVVQAFTELAKLADDALRLEANGDIQGAIELWHRVLGPLFPEPAAQSVEDALRAWNGGSISQAGRVSPVVLPAAAAYRPGRAWRSH